jgi:hypothetical protein
MKRALVIAALLAAAGCAADRATMVAEPTGSCEESIDSIAVDVTPATLVRGTTDALTITWELSTAPSTEALFHLSTSPDPAVELTGTLPETTATVRRASLDNPFGPGMPAGDATVYVWLGVPTSCPQPPDATTTFVIQ